MPRRDHGLLGARPCSANRHILDKWSTSEIGNPQETYALLLRLDCSAAGAPAEARAASARPVPRTMALAALTLRSRGACKLIGCRAPLRLQAPWSSRSPALRAPPAPTSRPRSRCCLTPAAARWHVSPTCCGLPDPLAAPSPQQGALRGVLRSRRMAQRWPEGAARHAEAPPPTASPAAGAAGGDGDLVDGLTLDSTPVDASALQQPGSTLLPSAATPEASLADRGALGPSVGGLTAGGPGATGASSGQPKGGQGIDCADSDLGYACAVDVGQGGLQLMCLSCTAKAGLPVVENCSMGACLPGERSVQALPLAGVQLRQPAALAQAPCTGASAPRCPTTLAHRQR